MFFLNYILIKSKAYELEKQMIQKKRNNWQEIILTSVFWIIGCFSQTTQYNELVQLNGLYTLLGLQLLIKRCEPLIHLKWRPKIFPPIISIFQLSLCLDKSIKGNTRKFLIIYNGSNTKNHLSSFLRLLTDLAYTT